LVDQDIDWRKILQWVLDEHGRKLWFSTRPMAGSCEHGDEASGSIKVVRFEKLSDY
jgi:hypothetical protein